MGAAHARLEGCAFGQRVAAAIGHQILRQQHGQVFFGHGLRAAAFAVDDGNGRAPVALAADTPVAQAPSGAFFAQALFGQQRGRLVHGLLVGQAVQRAAVDAHALLVGVVRQPLLGFGVAQQGGLIGFAGEFVQRLGLVFQRPHVVHLHGGEDDFFDVDAVLLRKGKVALVMRGHAHHCAVAIAHEHVVAHPHFHPLTSERVADVKARAHALFFLERQLGLGGAALLALFDEGGHFGAKARDERRQRVLGRNRHKGHAHEGVGAGGEHIQRPARRLLARWQRRRLAVAPGGGVVPVEGKAKAQALALANPVFLHQPHALGPAGERGLGVVHLHMVQQLLRVIGDLQVVARNLALFHQRAGAPAAPVNHLLVGQHGLIHRIPVHHLRLAVGDALFQHLQKQPLVPLVVAGVARGELAAPVNGQAHRLHLALHVGDVVVSPLRGRHAVLDGGVFGRQAKGVPAHGHEHVKALHAQAARDHVVDGVVAHMPHVQLAAGVRQHGAGVVLGAAAVFAHAPGLAGLPVRLGGLFNLGGVVTVLHDGARL